MDQNENAPHPVDVSAFAKEERDYLHAVANPLAIASGMLEALQEDLARSETTLSESQTRKLEKIQNSIDRIGTLIRERRARMIAIQDKIGRS